MKNRIYFFTGTGNSLSVAECIMETLQDCELIPICKDTPKEVPASLERLGFVFPSYASGPPNMVADFIANMEIPKQNDTYLFVVATYGGVTGSVLTLTGEMIKQKGWTADYGAAVRSYPNAVTAYPMIGGKKFFAKITKNGTKRIANDILVKQKASVSSPDAESKRKHEKFMAAFSNIDSDYQVNDNCISCGICKTVCPAKNISIKSGKPVFHHQCESCMACIQHCPKRAINYKDKTGKRGRYTHPAIGHKVIAAYYKEVMN